MDVKTTFLNGETEEEFYIEQPEGFMINIEKSHVYMLNKSLYGLKKAPCAWYEKMDGFLMSLDFNKSVPDPNLYYHIVGDKCLILVLYVDDLFLIGSESLITEMKLSNEFCFQDEGSGYDALLLGTRSMEEN
jgi:hypothetical protein